MAFDAGMLAACVNELKNTIVGAKVDKIYQPGREELVFVLRMWNRREPMKLLMSAGANTPRINISGFNLQNPATPPTFTQLLRKHLQGAKITDVEQLGFERACRIELEAHDDMNFKTKKNIVCEIMGKYSNIIFCDADMKIISAVKIVDLTTSHKRQVLPGMKYEMPPSQGKLNPLEETRASFKEALIGYEGELSKFITNRYMGISSLTAREISTLAKTMGTWDAFEYVINIIKNAEFTPILLRDKNKNPKEYSFFPITQYGSALAAENTETFGNLIDSYFGERERSDRIKQKANDLFKLIENSIARLEKKTALQMQDLENCSEKEVFKRYGDLITSNIYAIKRGMKTATLVDYYDPEMKEVEVPLDYRLDAPANAQKYYKRYNKLKKAETELKKQMDISKIELDYLWSVFESFDRAEGEIEINEIRRELYESGYASRMKNYTQIKQQQSKPLEFVTSNGYRVLCGKNNTQNERLTFKLASKGDYWFHAKNMPGSHVILFCDGMEEPPAEDFTQAAIIAATHSKAKEEASVEVDYSLIKNIKKPVAAKPGLVIYHTNYSALVTPSKSVCESLRVK
ncbi:MAG: NFACT family protein [Clostridia bacterium]|nr:NFACT family protein [Clostridia bacterium]